MKTLLFTFIATVLFVSCKKQNDCQPKEVEKLVYIKGDSVHTTDTVNIKITDTVYVNNTVLPLIGNWVLYKYENFRQGVPSTSYPNYLSVFTPTEFSFKESSGWVTSTLIYGQGYVEFTGGNASTGVFFVESINNGKEYKLTQSPGKLNYNVWYFRK